MYFLAFDELINKKIMQSLFPKATAIKGTFLNGYKLVFCTQAAIIKDATCSVPVAIWNVSEKDELALDQRYQSCPTFFEKEYIEIEIDGTKINAFTYILKESVANYRPPETSVLNDMTHGYMEFAFPITDLCVGLERTYKSLGKKVYYWFSEEEEKQ